MPLRDLRLDAEERLPELVDDARTAQLGERIVGRPRRDDRAVGQRLAWPMVVGDDHFEPERLRLGALRNGRDAAVDREHEAAALVGEPAEGVAADAVTLVEPARQVPVDVRPELAQQEDGKGRRGDSVDVVVAVHTDARPRCDRGPDALAREAHVSEQERIVGRALAREKRPRLLGVGVPAPDKDAGRKLTDPQRVGEPGLQPVRARTDRPGALVHRAVTVGRPPDDILGAVRGHFLLDPEVVYLNHGAYRACPRPVFERYQARQLELEREPTDFIERRLPELLSRARTELGAYLGARADDLTFVQNATTGVNLAARALDLQPGEEVLTTDLEYGACDYTWSDVCRRTGAHYVRAEIPLPLDGDVVERLFARRTARTRVVYVSHITSETGLLLPVEEIVARARAEGLVTIVDGAHAPGHVDLDLDALGADFYSGNCHKWTRAPSDRARGTRRPISPSRTRSRSFGRTTTARAASRSPAKRARNSASSSGRSPYHPTSRSGSWRACDCPPPTRSSRSGSSTTTASRSRRWARAVTTCCGSRSPVTPSRRTSSACSTPSRPRSELPAPLLDREGGQRAKLGAVLQRSERRLHRIPVADPGHLRGRAEQLPLRGDGRAHLHEAVAGGEHLRTAARRRREALRPRHVGVHVRRGRDVEQLEHDLAVRGHAEALDDRDEPPVVLLERSASRRRRLDRSGQLRDVADGGRRRRPAHAGLPRVAERHQLPQGPSASRARRSGMGPGGNCNCNESGYCRRGCKGESHLGTSEDRVKRTAADSSSAAHRIVPMPQRVTPRGEARHLAR